MEFYIGGFAQGKLEYVLRMHPGETLQVLDGETLENVPKTESRERHADGRIVLNHLHLWVRRMLEEGKEPERLVEEFLQRHEDCIVISDEAGNGIVPVEQTERDFRERLGRIQIKLAARAERVERVICGIGQRLK